MSTPADPARRAQRLKAHIEAESQRALRAMTEKVAEMTEPNPALGTWLENGGHHLYIAPGIIEKFRLKDAPE